jgi:hypothetical protein
MQPGVLCHSLLVPFSWNHPDFCVQWARKHHSAFSKAHWKLSCPLGLWFILTLKTGDLQTQPHSLMQHFVALERNSSPEHSSRQSPNPLGMSGQTADVCAPEMYVGVSEA